MVCNSRLLLTFLWIVGMGFGSRFAPAQELTEELKPLEHFVGMWSKDLSHLASKAVPKSVKEVGTHTTSWILEKKFLEEKGNDGNGRSYSTIYGYDDKTKAYRAWIFQSTGNRLEASGEWNAQSKTMTWTTIESGDIKSIMKYEFQGADTFKMTIKATGPSGDVLYHLEGTGKRSKAGTK
jgi:hypothetical protein